LLKAPVDQQPRIIDQLKDSKGIVNTDALAVAIPRLAAEAKTKARAALAERLTRMTNKTLRAKLTEEDAEVRRAAAHACMMKDDRSYVPDLIPLLKDADPIVARAAHLALKNLTKQDFGPAPDASASSRQQAVASWKAWWEKQASK
jgi:HEAT repeat protein